MLSRTALGGLLVVCSGLIISLSTYAQEQGDEHKLCVLKLVRAAQQPVYKESEKQMRLVINECRKTAGTRAHQIEQGFIYAVEQKDSVAAAHLARLNHESKINYSQLAKGFAIMSATAIISFYAGKQRGSSSSSSSS